MLLPAALPAAHIRHDAVGAEVVAAVHDRQPALEGAVTLDGNALIELFVVVSALKHALAVDERAVKQLGKMVKRMGAENQSDKRKAVVDAVGDMLLLHHTAAQRDQNLRMLPLEIFQCADVAEHPVLRVLSDSAGVEQNEVGVIGRIRKGKARFCQHTLDFFAVGDILLTAVGADIRQRNITALADAHQLGGQVQIFNLTVGHLDGFRQIVFLRSSSLAVFGRHIRLVCLDLMWRFLLSPKSRGFLGSPMMILNYYRQMRISAHYNPIIRSIIAQYIRLFKHFHAKYWDGRKRKPPVRRQATKVHLHIKSNALAKTLSRYSQSRYFRFISLS